MFVTIQKVVMPFGEGKKKRFEMGNLLPKIKELNFERLVWVMAVPRGSTWDEIKTTEIGAAYSYGTEIQQMTYRRKEALFPYSWLLPVGGLQYRGPAICPGTVAKWEIELRCWFPVKRLNHKSSLQLRSSFWSEGDGVRVVEFSWLRSQTELKCQSFWYCSLFGKEGKK